MLPVVAISHSAAASTRVCRIAAVCLDGSGGLSEPLTAALNPTFIPWLMEKSTTCSTFAPSPPVPSSVRENTRCIPSDGATFPATTEYVREERGGKVFVDSTRAGGATVAAAYSPRARPGVPVSFPVTWEELEQVRPGDLTILTAVERLSTSTGQGDPWAAATTSPLELPADLVAEGHEIPIARVIAMHEGKRRKRAKAQLEQHPVAE